MLEIRNLPKVIRQKRGGLHWLADFSPAVISGSFVKIDHLTHEGT